MLGPQAPLLCCLIYTQTLPESQPHLRQYPPSTLAPLTHILPHCLIPAHMPTPAEAMLTGGGQGKAALVGCEVDGP